MSRIIPIFLILLLASANQISALTIFTADKIGLDKSIFSDVFEEGLPSGIIVTPIFMPNINKLTEEDWVKGVYHYTVQRLGYSRLPYHYLINENGIIYSAEGSEDRLVKIKDSDKNNIIIGYLAKANSTTFADSAMAGLQDLIIEIANRNNIKVENITFTGTRFNRSESSNQVLIEKTQLFGIWSEKFRNIINTVQRNYNPTKRQHTFVVTESKLNTNTLVAGETTEGTLKVKNTGSNNLYITESNYVVVERAEGRSSRFYLNNNWVSLSEFEAITDIQTIKPAQEVEIKFKVRAPLYLGETKESFKLKMIGDGIINSDAFDLSLNVEKGNKKIVQIRSTETNFLRVRSAPSTVAEEIGRVASGERYLVIEEDGNGFYKLDLEGGRSGWVAGWLTDTI